MQSLQVKTKQFLKSAIMILFFIPLKRKLFAERGEPEQSCKLETLLQKFHPLWREKQVEQKHFFQWRKAFLLEKRFLTMKKRFSVEKIFLWWRKVYLMRTRNAQFLAAIAVSISSGIWNVRCSITWISCR